MRRYKIESLTFIKQEPKKNEIDFIVLDNTIIYSYGVWGGGRRGLSLYSGVESG
jgi:hypothetical protein